MAELRMALEDRARGQRLAQLRMRRRITQEEAARQLNVAYRTYQSWEHGVMPSWANMERLASFYGLRPEDILGEYEPPDTVSAQLNRIEAKVDALVVALAQIEHEHLSAAARDALRNLARAAEHGALENEKRDAPQRKRRRRGRPEE